MWNLPLLDGVVLGLLLGGLAGGKIRRLATRTVCEGAVPLAVLLLILARITQREILVLALWFVSQVSLLVWVFANRKIHGFSVLGVGLLLNTAVISANLGMPVQQPVKAETRLDALHVTRTSGTRLPVLCDALEVPRLRFHSGLASAGDVILVAGLAIVIIQLEHVGSRDGADLVVR